MPVRELQHPDFEIADNDEGSLRIRFTVEGSRLGSVEVVLSVDEVDLFVGLLEHARYFVGATSGDSDA